LKTYSFLKAGRSNKILTQIGVRLQPHTILILRLRAFDMMIKMVRPVNLKTMEGVCYMRVYLAGPITGKSFDEVMSRYKEKTAILIDFGYEVLSPMTAKGGLKGVNSFVSSGYAGPVANDHSIFERDRWMVSQADVVLVDLSNATAISIGTMMELAWASYLNKHTILVMGESNVHDHAFVKEAADIRLPDLEAAYDYLRELSLSQVGLS
jgi:nucleoside 2-deoxyribosyltransferase